MSSGGPADRESLDAWRARLRRKQQQQQAAKRNGDDAREKPSSPLDRSPPPRPASPLDRTPPQSRPSSSRDRNITPPPRHVEPTAKSPAPPIPRDPSPEESAAASVRRRSRDGEDSAARRYELALSSVIGGKGGGGGGGAGTIGTSSTTLAKGRGEPKTSPPPGRRPLYASYDETSDGEEEPREKQQQQQQRAAAAIQTRQLRSGRAGAARSLSSSSSRLRGSASTKASLLPDVEPAAATPRTVTPRGGTSGALHRPPGLASATVVEEEEDGEQESVYRDLIPPLTPPTPTASSEPPPLPPVTPPTPPAAAAASSPSSSRGGGGLDGVAAAAPPKVDEDEALRAKVSSLPGLDKLTRESREALGKVRRLVELVPVAGGHSPGSGAGDDMDKLRELDRLVTLANDLDEMVVGADIFITHIILRCILYPRLFSGSESKERGGMACLFVECRGGREGAGTSMVGFVAGVLSLRAPYRECTTQQRRSELKNNGVGAMLKTTVFVLIRCVCCPGLQSRDAEDKDMRQKELALAPGQAAYNTAVRTGLCRAYLAASVVGSSLALTGETCSMEKVCRRCAPGEKLGVPAFGRSMWPPFVFSVFFVCVLWSVGGVCFWPSARPANSRTTMRRACVRAVVFSAFVFFCRRDTSWSFCRACRWSAEGWPASPQWLRRLVTASRRLDEWARFVSLPAVARGVRGGIRARHHPMPRSPLIIALAKALFPKPNLAEAFADRRGRRRPLLYCFVVLLLVSWAISSCVCLRSPELRPMRLSAVLWRGGWPYGSPTVWQTTKSRLQVRVSFDSSAVDLAVRAVHVCTIFFAHCCTPD